MKKLSEEQIQVLKRYFKWFVSRTVTVLVLFFLFSALFVDYDRINRKAKVKFLNDFMPPVSYFLAFQDQGEEFNEQTFKDLILYYKKVIEFIPNRPDIYSLLGYCHYQLGDKKRSIAYYQKALSIAPYNFWFYYNLGIIYYEDGKYEEAADYLTSAILSNPNSTLKFASVSRAYWRILYGKDNVGTYLMRNLKIGYRDAHVLLILSYQSQEKYNEILNIVKKAIKEELEDSEVFYYYLGVSLHKLGNHRMAVNALVSSIDKDMFNLDAYNYLSLSLKAMGDYDQASKIDKQHNFFKSKGLTPDPIDQNIKTRIF